MLPFAHVVNADVGLSTAGHFAGEFRADEEIRQVAEFFRTFYGVMVRESEQIHSAPA
jgi:hypothetical protein